MRPKPVMKMYLQTYFPLDLAMTTADWLAMFVAIMFQSAGESDITSLFAKFPRIVKVTKVIRLMSMLRVARFVEPLERLGNQYFSEALRLVVNMIALLVLVFWLNHLLGCTWFWIATQSAGESETGFTWRDSSFVEDGPRYRDTVQMFQYLTAFHWAMTQMTPGSMPVQPFNSTERIFNIVCLILGLAFFSSVISSMTATLTQLKMLRQEREKVMLNLEKFLRRKTISREVALSVRKQVKARMTQVKPLEIGDVEGLSMLSVTLRQDLMYDLSKTHLRSHQIFRVVEQTDISVLAQICVGVNFRVLMSQDVLFMQDKSCDETYFVISGTYSYVQRPSDHMEIVVEKQWLSWAALWSHWAHTGTAEAGSTSEVLVMQTDSVCQCVCRCGDLRSLFEDYAVTYHQRLVSPVADLPSDLRVPFAEYPEIILGIEQKQQQLIGSLALDRLEPAKWSWQGLTVQELESLQEEVFSGRCVLVENQEGVAERVVPLAAVRLERNDGDVLVVLAKMNSSGVLRAAGGIFPGAKHMPGELPGKALERILKDQLSFAFNARIHSSQREDIEEESARFYITTKYIRSVFRVTLPFSYEQPTFFKGRVSRKTTLPVERRKSLSSRMSFHFGHDRQHWLPAVSDCFAVPDGKGEKGFNVCAWVDPDAVEFFKKPEGKKQIESWVADCDIDLGAGMHVAENKIFYDDEVS